MPEVPHSRPRERQSSFTIEQLKNAVKANKEGWGRIRRLTQLYSAMWNIHKSGSCKTYIACMGLQRCHGFLKTSFHLLHVACKDKGLFELETKGLLELMHGGDYGRWCTASWWQWAPWQPWVPWVPLDGLMHVITGPYIWPWSNLVSCKACLQLSKARSYAALKRFSDAMYYRTLHLRFHGFYGF